MKKTIIVDDLVIKVVYRVGLGNAKMPIEVYNQLIDAGKHSKRLDVSGGSPKHQQAAEWLVDNIKERDCCDWVAEVQEISEHENC